MPLVPAPAAGAQSVVVAAASPAVAPRMSPGAWLELLERRLADQQLEIKLYQDYYDGNHRLAYATAKYQEAFGELFAPFADNWCQIVVDASVERLRIVGFRFGDQQADDTEAWRIWQANSLDAESLMAHTEAVKCGRAYLLVDPADGDTPRITIEHPAQVIVMHAAGDRRTRVAALKKWLGEDGYGYANVYLADAVHKFRSANRTNLTVPAAAGGGAQWVRRQDDPGGLHQMQAVPVVPLYNNPDMLAGGRSDLAVAIPLQDAITKEALDLIVASEFAAYRQRVLMGVEIPKDPVTQEPLPGAELKALQSRLWVFDNENAKIGEFQATDLANYTGAIEMLVSHLAAQTRTPPHYLLAKMVNISGDALKAAETGLVAKVRRKQQDFAESWEEAMRLAFRARGDEERATAMDAETLWRDPENRTMGEVVDAQVKLRTIGVPLEMLWERAGFTPQDIERMKTLIGLPDRPPPGAAAADVPPVLGGTANGASAPTP